MFATFARVLLGMLNVRPTFEGIAFDQKLGGTFCIRGVVRSRQKHPLSYRVSLFRCNRRMAALATFNNNKPWAQLWGRTAHMLIKPSNH